MCDLGIQEIPSLEVTVNPNPSANSIELSGNDLPLIKELTIYDLNGKMVKYISQSEINTRISLEALENGVYLLALNGNSKMLRLIKQE
ncbi:T9SS type A sorting domain-containing protein [Fluviicola sp.]|uniref:T9SS type A sorting domain-containing protein n=1 Tax=Fluviicola sp. TaxID=1917219 RepID=UPI003D275B0E